MTNRLDILILGATGFTGLHCIPYIHRLSKSDDRNLTWGVAGRSQEKLKQVLEKAGKELNADFGKIAIIVADIGNDESLLKMAQQTKVLINCCGPYRFLGEPVVKACIAAGTHHVDVSGEPQFVERVQLEHHEAAKEKGVYVISTCGFDSIPNDLGVVYLQQQFEGTLNSVVTYMKVWNEEKSASGSLLNFGTWESAVYGLAYWGELKELRRKLFAKKIPTFHPKLRRVSRPEKSDVVDGWVVPFMGVDRSVIRRTQTYFYEEESKRPVQFDTLIVIKSFFYLIMMIIGGLVFAILTRFDCGRKLLLNYPQIFSFGMFSKDPPPEEMIEKTWFQLTLYGEGWKVKLANKDDQYSSPCDSKIVGRVKGRNPGYGATCICLVLSAIVIATEQEKMPGKGGVFTPGAAFAKTSLIKQLNENEVTFDIILQKEI